MSFNPQGWKVGKQICDVRIFLGLVVRENEPHTLLEIAKGGVRFIDLSCFVSCSTSRSTITFLNSGIDEDKWVGRKVLFNSRLDWKQMSLFSTKPGVSSRLYLSVLQDGEISAWLFAYILGFGGYKIIPLSPVLGSCIARPGKAGVQTLNSNFLSTIL